MLYRCGEIEESKTRKSTEIRCGAPQPKESRGKTNVQHRKNQKGSELHLLRKGWRHKRGVKERLGAAKERRRSNRDSN